jgi:two-component system OmpR family response regulator
MGGIPKPPCDHMSTAAFLMSTTPTLRVLLVEDSVLLAARIAELIRRLPDVELIDTVDNEAEALRRVASSTPDAVILDLHLRAGSGFGVLRALGRDAARRPKVIVLTGFDLPEYRREAESFGVEAFLNKSREYHRLPTLLADFVSGRTPSATPGGR